MSIEAAILLQTTQYVIPTPFAFESATEEQISMGNKKLPPTCILLVSVKYIL